MNATIRSLIFILSNALKELQALDAANAANRFIIVSRRRPTLLFWTPSGWSFSEENAIRQPELAALNCLQFITAPIEDGFSSPEVIDTEAVRE